MDDLAERPQEVDILINHNLYAEVLDYSGYQVSRLLVGPEYALIRSGFASAKQLKRPDPAHILVSFGGTDDGRYARAVCSLLTVALPHVPIDVALTRAPAAGMHTQETGRIEVHVGRDLEELVPNAKLYIGGAGVTLMEMISAGLSVVACSIAHNQRLNVICAQRFGISAIEKFHPEFLVQSAVEAYPVTGQEQGPAIDGKGAARVAAEIVEIID